MRRISYLQELLRGCILICAAAIARAIAHDLPHLDVHRVRRVLQYGKPLILHAAELQAEVPMTPHFMFRCLLCTKKLQTRPCMHRCPGAYKLGMVMAFFVC